MRKLCLLPLVIMLLIPSLASAWKPHGHLWVANKAINDIMNGREQISWKEKSSGIRKKTVTRTIHVGWDVAESIRRYPEDFRGGVIGPDAFPDIVGGQGAIHPHFAPWVKHVHEAGHQAYSQSARNARECGCSEAEQDVLMEPGQRALSFSYGYMIHAAGDMWGHSFVNSHARGVFPGMADLIYDQNRQIAIRHIIVEGYVDKHTPDSNNNIDAPIEFIRDTFIEHSPAALDRGKVLQNIVTLRTELDEKLKAVQKEYEETNCYFNPIDCSLLLIEEEYLTAWLADINVGIDKYLLLQLDIANFMFGGGMEFDDQTQTFKPNSAAAIDAIQYWVINYGLSMAGAPDALGASIQGLGDFGAWLASFLPTVSIQFISELKTNGIDYLTKSALGVSLTEVREYTSHPEKYINKSAWPVNLPANTSAKIDQLMGIRNGTQNNTLISSPLGNPNFAPMHNSVMLAKLALVNQGGMNKLLRTYGASGNYPHSNVMLGGWLHSIDGDHQWQGGPHGGEGMEKFYLWRSCSARQKVFRKLFRDWEHATNFPDPANARCARSKR